MNIPFKTSLLLVLFIFSTAQSADNASDQNTESFEDWVAIVDFLATKTHSDGTKIQDATFTATSINPQLLDVPITKQQSTINWFNLPSKSTALITGKITPGTNDSTNHPEQKSQSNLLHTIKENVKDDAKRAVAFIVSCINGNCGDKED